MVQLLRGAELPSPSPLMISQTLPWKAERRARRPHTVAGAGGTMFLQQILLLHFPTDPVGLNLSALMTRVS